MLLINLCIHFTTAKTTVNDYRVIVEILEYNPRPMNYSIHEMPTQNLLSAKYAVDGTECKGTITVDVLEDENLLWLVELLVAPAMENMGFGAHLLAAGMQVGLANRLSTVIGTFEPDRDARRVADWYRKRGFSIEGRNMRGDIQVVHDSCLTTMSIHNLHYDIVPLTNILGEKYSLCRA